MSKRVDIKVEVPISHIECRICFQGIDHITRCSKIEEKHCYVYNMTCEELMKKMKLSR